MPAIIPVFEPITAIAVLLLLHVPPGVESVRGMVAPGQTEEAPEIVPTGSILPPTDNPLLPVSDE